jgi:hypothetical protein
MRKQFVTAQTLDEAEAACPWAAQIIEADGGYWCFESTQDADTWQSQE